jgi:1-acyl-sn-glycerol-3-phosphate acyltransferase
MREVATRVAVAAWSAIFWPMAFSWMLIGATSTLVLLVVRLPYQRVHGWVTAPVFKRCVQLSLTKLRLHYHPRFDPERRGVFAQNHINLLDGHLASWAIPHAFSGLMNAWQFKIPIYGWLMSMSKGSPVRRGRRDETVAEISREARARREIGMSVLVFPEGHRTLDGKVRSFKRGVFMMARNAELPVVPIAVRGMYEVNRKGSMLFWPFRPVDVFVGPQFETAGLSDSEVGALMERVRAYMVACIEHNAFPDADADAAGAQPRANAESRAPSLTSAARTHPT